MEIKISSISPQKSKEDHQISLERTPVNICGIHLNGMENGTNDSSSEAHLQSSETNRGFFLYQVELYIII